VPRDCVRVLNEPFHVHLAGYTVKTDSFVTTATVVRKEKLVWKRVVSLPQSCVAWLVEPNDVHYGIILFLSDVLNVDIPYSGFSLPFSIDVWFNSHHITLLYLG
jgi:hypothetical protein